MQIHPLGWEGLGGHAEVCFEDIPHLVQDEMRLGAPLGPPPAGFEQWGR